jgi:hypothetical protein
MFKVIEGAGVGLAGRVLVERREQRDADEEEQDGKDDGHADPNGRGRTILW